MHAKLDEFEKVSIDFEQNAIGQAKLLLSVIFVGFKLTSIYNKEKVDELMPDRQECSDGTSMIQEFPISQNGELINLIERIHKIAQMQRTIVLTCDDR